MTTTGITRSRSHAPRIGLAALLAVAAGIAFAPALHAEPLKTLTKIKVGAVSALSDAGIYIANERGYFKDENIEIEIINFKAGPQIIPALATDQTQVSGLSVSPAMFNAYQRGLSMKIVADKGQVSKGFGWAALSIRADLADKVKDYKDLKGLTIAVPAKGVSTFTQLGKALELGHLAVTDVNIVELGFPDMVAALTNKRIDAAMLIEPFIALAVEKKIAVRWKGVEDFYPFRAQNGVLLYSERFSKESPEAAKRWMVAYLRGVRTYLGLLATPDGHKEIAQVLMKYTQVKDPSLYDKMAPIGLDPNGRVEEASIQADQDWYIKLGLQPQRVDLDKIIDNSYVDAAAAELGKK